MGAGTTSEMKNLECITLFVEDLAASTKFYLEIFDLKNVYEDPVSAVFKLASAAVRRE
jgi:catechol 2,3-dioxygenase-like lactoylglutathione lyase family enzyme